MFPPTPSLLSTGSRWSCVHQQGEDFWTIVLREDQRLESYFYPIKSSGKDLKYAVSKIVQQKAAVILISQINYSPECLGHLVNHLPTEEKNLYILLQVQE